MNGKWFANTAPPPRSELPSKRTLVGASVAVVLVWTVIFLVAVLPAERGIDPTGLGGPSGLTEMGLFKVEAAEEFAAMAVIAAQNAADSVAAAAAAANAAEATPP